MEDTKRIGRTGGANSQVARGAPRFGSVGDWGVWNIASGADRRGESAASHGIHHASRRPWGSSRDLTAQNHWKWHAYVIAASGVAFAIGSGLTLMEVFKR